MTSDKLNPMICQQSLFGALDFPAKIFPLQANKGGLGGGRSGLFWEIVRLLAGRKEEDRPQYLLIENVKNLLSVGRGFDFARLLCALAELGYSCEWQVLNSKDFGVAQNRERVFIVGHLGDGSRRKVFPIQPTDGENSCKLQEITQGVSDAYRIYASNGIARTLKGEAGGLGAKTGLYAIDMTTNNPKITDNVRCLKARYIAGMTNFSGDNSGILVAPVLTPDREEKRQNGRRIKEVGEPMFTITAQDRHGIAIIDDKPKDIGSSVFIVDDQGRIKKDLILKNHCPTLRAQMHGNIPKVIDATYSNRAPSITNYVPTLRSARNGLLVALNNISKIKEQGSKLRDVIGLYTGDSMKFHRTPLKGLSRTIKAEKFDAGITDGIRIRKLTPLETWRLQGFADIYFYKAKQAGVSDSQLYKQAGNSVTVNVSRAIGFKLKKIESECA